MVSTDFVGSRRAGIVDGLATIANGNDLVLYVWYDNEFGYSCQVVRVMEEMAGSHPLVLPERQPVVLERELAASVAVAVTEPPWAEAVRPAPRNRLRLEA